MKIILLFTSLLAASPLSVHCAPVSSFWSIIYTLGKPRPHEPTEIVPIRFNPLGSDPTDVAIAADILPRSDAANFIGPLADDPMMDPNSFINQDSSEILGNLNNTSVREHSKCDTSNASPRLHDIDLLVAKLRSWGRIYCYNGNGLKSKCMLITTIKKPGIGNVAVVGLCGRKGWIECQVMRDYVVNIKREYTRGMYAGGRWFIDVDAFVAVHHG